MKSETLLSDRKLLVVLGEIEKESGENAFELIKRVGGVALKYVPLFFSLLR
jgi:hypothetical protein